MKKERSVLIDLNGKVEISVRCPFCKWDNIINIRYTDVEAKGIHSCKNYKCDKEFVCKHQLVAEIETFKIVPKDD